MKHFDDAPKTRAALRLNDEQFDWFMAVIAVIVIVGGIWLVFKILTIFGG
jgi:hypothetical protein